MAWGAQQGDHKVARLNDPMPSKSASVTACSAGKHEKGDLSDRPFLLPTTDAGFICQVQLTPNPYPSPHKSWRDLSTAAGA
jgi:hypothetical protein